MKVGILGLGHIGFPLALFLHERGHNVYSWSRSPKSFPWIHSTTLETASDWELDCFIVASGGARPSLANLDLEYKSTLSLVHSCSLSKSTRIMYLSSGAVYGECSRPMNELDPVKPTTRYGEIKAKMEEEFFKSFGNRCSSLRIGNVIDMTNPYGLLRLISRAHTLEKLDFFGEPQDCRDYIDIHDLSLIFAKIIEGGNEERILNVGSGISISLQEFADLVQTIQSKLTISWNPARHSDISKTKLDVTKVCDWVGITPGNPKTVLEEHLCNVT